MKNIVIPFILALSLASCSTPWDNDTERKIAELEKRIVEIKNTTSTGMLLFEKRTRCASLSPDIEKKTDSINKEYASLGKFSIGEIFYSPAKDACLWVRLTDTYAPDGSPMERRALYRFGEDFGASEPLIGCEKILGEKRGTDTCSDWDAELRKLK